MCKKKFVNKFLSNAFLCWKSFQLNFKFFLHLCLIIYSIKVKVYCKYYSSHNNLNHLSAKASFISVIAFLPKPFIEESFVSVDLVNCSTDSILQFINAFNVLGDNHIISIGV